MVAVCLHVIFQIKEYLANPEAFAVAAAPAATEAAAESAAPAAEEKKEEEEDEDEDMVSSYSMMPALVLSLSLGLRSLRLNRSPTLHFIARVTPCTLTRTMCIIVPLLTCA